MIALWKFITSRPVKMSATVIVALLGIYGTFFYERKPNLLFEVVSNASVIDVKETLSKLVITYDGTNLKQQDQNLFLTTIRIANRGSSDIVITSFDSSAPLGYGIKSGTILESPTIIADEYLKNNVRPT